jgi:succinyl-CoA synthetase beta subunit
MNIHEYQAKALLRDYGAPVADGHVAATPEAAVHAAKALKPGAWVVKAQIHAGGRGKGGGIKLVNTLEELRGQAERMLGKPLVTPQTGLKGRPVAQVYVVEDVAIERELYLSLLVDRDSGRVAFIASTEGGVNIEEVAAKTPEKITTLTVDPASGLWPFHTRIIASALKLTGEQAKQCAKLVNSLYQLFLEKDASLVEINPLVVSKEGRLICLDAKIGFDDNAVFRHPDVAALRDFDQEEPAEVEASRLGLAYVKLDGTIGCMVNGAGLAMATMDIIKLRGGEPANFLDVGGGASKEKIAEALKIILSDPHVKGVLVNIFGGIMRCDVIAEGVIAAVREVKISVPLVVRLEGTNVARGKALLQESGLAVIPADDLDDAARKIVAAVKEAT